MIRAAHVILYSRDAEADRAFFRDVLGLSHVDVGDGWLIFALPPSEVAMHPSDEGGKHQLYLVTDDVEAFVETMRARAIACSEIADMGWGRITNVTLPGGDEIGVYEARHQLAHDAS